MRKSLVETKFRQGISWFKMVDCGNMTFLRSIYEITVTFLDVRLYSSTQ